MATKVAFWQGKIWGVCSNEKRKQVQSRPRCSTRLTSANVCKFGKERTRLEKPLMILGDKMRSDRVIDGPEKKKNACARIKKKKHERETYVCRRCDAACGRRHDFTHPLRAHAQVYSGSRSSPGCSCSDSQLAVTNLLFCNIDSS